MAMLNNQRVYPYESWVHRNWSAGLILAPRPRHQDHGTVAAGLYVETDKGKSQEKEMSVEDEWISNTTLPTRKKSQEIHFRKKKRMWECQEKETPGEWDVKIQIC